MLSTSFILRQPERTVMSLMGWSSTDMTKRYQDVTDTVRTDVASQVGDLIWQAASEVTSEETVTLQRQTLATILPLVEDALNDNEEHVDIVELQQALEDLHTAISATSNE